MSETYDLDRAIEEALCTLIQAVLPLSAQAAQVVPDSRGSGESDATLPRIVVKAESQETPELYTVGVYAVATEVRTIVEATSPDQAGQMFGMNQAVDSVLSDCQLPSNLANGAIQVYGAVIGGKTQERDDNRLIRVRSITIHARLR